VDSTNHRQIVTVYGDKQYITGKDHKPGDYQYLPESIYNQALDTLVIGCVDVVPMYNGRILIGLRAWEPQRDWWCFGGRMRKGEFYEVAAARNVKRELFPGVDEMEIHPNRFVLVGVYNLIWDRRAQEPLENGCHMLSVTMLLHLIDSEATSLRPNEEYCETRWILPDDIIHHPNAYHPCLVQIAKDVAEISKRYL